MQKEILYSFSLNLLDFHTSSIYNNNKANLKYAQAQNM